MARSRNNCYDATHKTKISTEKLIDGQELARLSKRLVTIDRQVPMEYEIADLVYKKIDQEKTKIFYRTRF